MTEHNNKNINPDDLYPLTALIDQTGVQQLINIFDLIPDTLFWIKDTNSRMLYVNAPLKQHLGVSDNEQVIGLTDFNFAPPHIAKQFISDDKKVMNGATITNRLEINITNEGEIAWYVTSKKPLYDDNQKIIGTYGISRHLEPVAITLPGMAEIKGPVDHIKKHYMLDFDINKLAKMAHMSVSTLERRFKKCINKTPKQFINEVRLENARRLLIETGLPIAVISCKSGFANHSYFSRKFAEMFDDIPSVFRHNHHNTHSHSDSL